MNMRADTYLTAAEIAIVANNIAKKHQGLGSVTEIHVSPNVVNVIPDSTEFVIDTRHATNTGLENIEADIESEVSKIIKGTDVTIEFKKLFHNDATHFNKECIDIVEECATNIVGKNKTTRMISGAGHDSCSTTNAKVPTSMIVIPSKGGISHNPVEYSSPEEIEKGFKVLLDTVVTFDSRRTD